VNNKVFHLSREDLDSVLKSNDIGLNEAIETIEDYSMHRKQEFGASDNNYETEGLMWSITLRAYLILEEHCK